MNHKTCGLQRESGPKFRNQSIECCRLIGSVFVVFIHCEFPGTFGRIMNCLARFAVPFFFAVSGYFVYQVREKTIKKRLWSIVKLTIFANILYLLWGSYLSGVRDLHGLVIRAVDMCSPYALSRMLLLCKSPFGGHLWYLNALIVCYLLIWIYVCWEEQETCRYQPLYIVSVCLYAMHVVLGSFATACEFEIPYHIYRNALLYGLPMFVLGIFLREYGQKIIRVYNLTNIKLLGFIVLGACLSVLQWKGTGSVEMPLGTLLEVIALILLLGSMPVLFGNAPFLSGMISHFGSLSTYVYITHLIWSRVYEKYIQKYVLYLGEKWESYLCPVFIVGLTLVTGILYITVKTGLQRLSDKMKMQHQPEI